MIFVHSILQVSKDTTVYHWKRHMYLIVFWTVGLWHSEMNPTLFWNYTPNYYINEVLEINSNVKYKGHPWLIK